ncbi:MAG: hypothetical protein FJ276_26170 [Planctomycetes bacterium]|nr:hypothetical protein [Planctomycetota bacterium]
MTIRILGEHPLARDEHGHLKTGIGTVFPRDEVVVTVPGMSHMMQREAYLRLVNDERIARGEPPLTEEQRSALWFEAVDLILEQEWSEKSEEGEDRQTVEDRILIRPDPDQMPLAFAADELLRALTPPVSIWQVRFQAARNTQVHEAVKRRGQCWRITPLAQTTAQMKQMIATAKAKLGGRAIYHYSRPTGTRWLTCDEFAQLGQLTPESLRQHLLEIRRFSAETNGNGNPEIAFFLGGTCFTKRDFAANDFSSLAPHELAAAHRELAAKFRDAVPVDLRRDNLEDEMWRSRMFATLIGERDEVVSEETLLGLGSEFFMKIEWLPGARFDNGELLVDACFHEQAIVPQHRRRPCDEKTLGFIFNFIREFGNLEHVNIGRVIGSMSRSRRPDGRRDVYIAVVKVPEDEREIVKIIRMQKRGVREHLDDGEELLQALLKSESYTDFVLDRRLACRQLGMNLTQRILARKVNETYQGKQTRYRGLDVLSPYFERDYIQGIATDKIPTTRFQRDGYALRFARLLGQAAAPNMIVGRCGREGSVVFDDGDELAVEDANGLPHEIVLSDQMGTFSNCTTPLAEFAPAYARPVNTRLKAVPDGAAFAEAYLDGFSSKFSQVQQLYRSSRSAFDALFRHRRLGPGSSIVLRWVEVLHRLEEADVAELTRRIRDNMHLPCHL